MAEQRKGLIRGVSNSTRFTSSSDWSEINVFNSEAEESALVEGFKVVVRFVGDAESGRNIHSHLCEPQVNGCTA